MYLTIWEYSRYLSTINRTLLYQSWNKRTFFVLQEFIIARSPSSIIMIITAHIMYLLPSYLSWREMYNTIIIIQYFNVYF